VTVAVTPVPLGPPETGVPHPRLVPAVVEDVAPLFDTPLVAVAVPPVVPLIALEVVAVEPLPVEANVAEVDEWPSIPLDSPAGGTPMVTPAPLPHPQVSVVFTRPATPNSAGAENE
jgi:hypothetical protein